MVRLSSSDTNMVAQLNIGARLTIGAVGEFWLVKPLFITGQKKSRSYTTNKISVTKFHL